MTAIEGFAHWIEEVAFIKMTYKYWYKSDGYLTDPAFLLAMAKLKPYKDVCMRNSYDREDMGTYIAMYAMKAGIELGEVRRL